jgi:hypothetical protein
LLLFQNASQLFEKHGTVNDFWMNSIKSFAIVTFAETAAATGLSFSLSFTSFFSLTRLSGDPSREKSGSWCSLATFYWSSFES